MVVFTNLRFQLLRTFLLQKTLSKFFFRMCRNQYFCTIGIFLSYRNLFSLKPTISQSNLPIMVSAATSNFLSFIAALHLRLQFCFGVCNCIHTQNTPNSNLGKEIWKWNTCVHMNTRKQTWPSKMRQECLQWDFFFHLRFLSRGCIFIATTFGYQNESDNVLDQRWLQQSY